MISQSQIDAVRDIPVPAYNHLIGGKSLAASDERTMDVISPINGSVLTTISRGTELDINAAVANARAIFEADVWAGMPPASRKNIMHKWADLIEENAIELAVLGVRDNGTEISMAFKAEPLSAAATIRYYAESIDKIYGEIAPTINTVLGLIHREPVGVVGAIIPWNFPLMIGAWKMGPALAAGNSVVIKPPETASLTLVRMAELALEAGLPEGALNVVTGEGPIVGAALAKSMGVDVLTFTGSGGTGRKLLEYSAQSNLKRVYLELGGKSPQVVFNDTEDLELAAKTVASGIFRNSGQVCVAGSRLIVQQDIEQEFVKTVADFSKQMNPGNPLELATKIGAVNSEMQLLEDLKSVRTAVSEGGEIVVGSNRCLEETGGYYMEPTIVTGVSAEDSLFQKEVFGPVLSVTSFESEETAINLANNSDLGLAAGVWTSNLSRAHRMVAAIKSGVVHVNTYGGPDVTVPLSGHKQSGNGSDKSLHALEKFSNLKTAWIQI